MYYLGIWILRDCWPEQKLQKPHEALAVGAPSRPKTLVSPIPASQQVTPSHTVSGLGFRV